jgi:hypothetical protein
MKQLIMIVAGLVTFLVMYFAIHLTTSSGEEAMAQSATATPTPQFTIQQMGQFNAYLSGITSVTGVAVAVTNNVTEESSINFYFQCIPKAKVGKLGTCPDSGIFVQSQAVCNAQSPQACLTPP